MGKEIIVSVVVITYNSAKYILETLESIKNQTYKDIELIISDDKSTDETIDIVKTWVEENKSRFVKCIIVETESNTGITMNCNRGMLKSSGEYIKLIAGDDVLLDNCVADLLRYCIGNNLEFTYGGIIPFTTNGDEEFENKLALSEQVASEFMKLDLNTQYKKLLQEYSLPTISLFIKKEFILKIGLYDEKYKMMEDYPFAIKVMSMGYRINYLDTYVAKYRVRTEDMNVALFGTKRKSLHTENLISFMLDEIIPRLYKEKMYISIYNVLIRILAMKIESIGSGKFYSTLGKIVRYFSFSVIHTKIKMIKRKRCNS